LVGGDDPLLRPRTAGELLVDVKYTSPGRAAEP